MNFDHTQITNIHLNFRKGGWNPETHSVVLEYDPTKPAGFNIKMVPVEEEVTDLSQAVDVLNKIKNK